MVRLSERERARACWRSFSLDRTDENGGEGYKGGKMTHAMTQHARPPVPCAPRKLSNVCSTQKARETKMADNVVFPRKLLQRFITLYKEQACLWDRTCPAYKQKQKRHESISKLTELVQEYDPGATKVHVLRKIESLRACVRREYKKVQDSRAKATSPDQIYVPHLWYYDMFTFVFGEDGNNYKIKPESPTQSPGQNEESEEEPAEEDNYEQLESYAAEYKVETSMLDIEANKQYFSEDTKKRCEVDDEYDAIGINVAAKLRTLPQNMRILAEKLINDVLYQAQMHGLSSSTVVTTPDPFK